MLDANRQTKSTFSLTDWFNRPQIIENSKSIIEDLTIGMVTQNLEETDNTFVKQVLIFFCIFKITVWNINFVIFEQINDELFACGNEFGIDLRAADIQRDRDHALSYYNNYRKFCGLKEATSFDDYSDTILPEVILTWYWLLLFFFFWGFSISRLYIFLESSFIEEPLQRL